MPIFCTKLCRKIFVLASRNCYALYYFKACKNCLIGNFHFYKTISHMHGDLDRNEQKSEASAVGGLKNIHIGRKTRALRRNSWVYFVHARMFPGEMSVDLSITKTGNNLLKDCDLFGEEYRFTELWNSVVQLCNLSRLFCVMRLRWLTTQDFYLWWRYRTMKGIILGISQSPTSKVVLCVDTTAPSASPEWESMKSAPDWEAKFWEWAQRKCIPPKLMLTPPMWVTDPKIPSSWNLESHGYSLRYTVLLPVIGAYYHHYSVVESVHCCFWIRLHASTHCQKYILNHQ